MIGGFCCWSFLFMGIDVFSSSCNGEFIFVGCISCCNFIFGKAGSAFRLKVFVLGVGGKGAVFVSIVA